VRSGVLRQRTALRQTRQEAARRSLFGDMPFSLTCNTQSGEFEGSRNLFLQKSASRLGQPARTDEIFFLMSESAPSRCGPGRLTRHSSVPAVHAPIRQRGSIINTVLQAADLNLRSMCTRAKADFWKLRQHWAPWPGATAVWCIPKSAGHSTKYAALPQPAPSPGCVDIKNTTGSEMIQPGSTNQDR
jgi:hypothetical protein